MEEEINSKFEIEKTYPTSRNSLRVGVLGYKVGMTSLWDQWGEHIPCSVVQIDRCQVLQVKNVEQDGVNAIQIVCGQLTNPK